MTSVRAHPAHDVRAVLCLKFAPAAPFDEVREAKARLIRDERIVHAIEVSGAFDFLAEIKCLDLADYQEFADGLGSTCNELIARQESSFICRRFQKDRDPHDFLWVPTVSGSRHLDRSAVDKVTSEGDYVRVHSAGISYLLRATMKSFEATMDDSHFVRANRSTIVRRDFVDSLIHDDGRWWLRLSDGSRHLIAKTRQSSVIACLKSDSSMENDGSIEHARVRRPVSAIC